MFENPTIALDLRSFWLRVRTCASGRRRGLGPAPGLPRVGSGDALPLLLRHCCGRPHVLGLLLSTVPCLLKDETENDLFCVLGHRPFLLLLPAPEDTRPRGVASWRPGERLAAPSGARRHDRLFLAFAQECLRLSQSMFGRH